MTARHHVVFVLRSVDPVSPVVETVTEESPLPPSGAMVREGPHLLQWFTARAGTVEAHYLFDDAYVAAHPEALDRAHLAMLHALLTFKLFDDGEVLIPPRQLAGVVRWPGIDERRKPLVSSEI
jgi:hypothetical protein